MAPRLKAGNFHGFLDSVAQQSGEASKDSRETWWKRASPRADELSAVSPDLPSDQAVFAIAVAFDLGLTRNRYRGVSMVSNGTPWRHLAFTWNSVSRTASSYLDYQLQSSTRLKSDPGWDVSRLVIGGDESGKAFRGLLDEIRVTNKSLQPWQFLRHSNVSLTGISFAPEAEPALPVES
jgi:hypothetical protein